MQLPTGSGCTLYGVESQLVQSYLLYPAALMAPVQKMKCGFSSAFVAVPKSFSSFKPAQSLLGKSD